VHVREKARAFAPPARFDSLPSFFHHRSSEGIWARALRSAHALLAVVDVVSFAHLLSTAAKSRQGVRVEESLANQQGTEQLGSLSLFGGRETHTRARAPRGDIHIRQRRASEREERARGRAIISEGISEVALAGCRRRIGGGGTFSCAERWEEMILVEIVPARKKRSGFSAGRKIMSSAIFSREGKNQVNLTERIFPPLAPSGRSSVSARVLARRHSSPPPSDGSPPLSPTEKSPKTVT